MRNIIGWRIYYEDASVVSSKDTAWQDAPSIGVQVVTVYYNETYRIWHDDHWDVENYCTLLNGLDYYWNDGTNIGNDDAPTVPANLPDGAIKVGTQLTDDAFTAIFNQANQERVF